MFLTKAALMPFMKGCGTGAGLIIAIGAQNAFVLRQGILDNYIFVTVLLCAVIDVCMISIGVGGLGAYINDVPILLGIAKWGGAAFLGYYGFRAFRSALQANVMSIDKAREQSPTLKATVMATLAISLLNPHLYLDTVVLLGSISAQFCDADRVYFAGGAILASLVVKQ